MSDDEGFLVFGCEVIHLPESSRIFKKGGKGNVEKKESVVAFVLIVVLGFIVIGVLAIGLSAIPVDPKATPQECATCGIPMW